MLQKHNESGAPPPPVVLTIAGSDSGGGAGIQADLKAFLALDCHGVSAIAALTAQNTRGVSAIHRPPTAFLRAQLEALFDDFPIAALKIGMLGSAAVVEAVAGVLEARAAVPIVLDPVLVASSGARLGDRRGLAALRARLLPMADVLTPNLPEAQALLGRAVAAEADLLPAARALLAQVRGGVLLKGGHLDGDTLVDTWLAPGRPARQWRHRRLAVNGHGTGCTLSAAIAARLAHGDPPEQAVDRAIVFLQAALAAAFRPGRGPLHVLAPLAGR
jgi:hydroxymethylpyrimidine/phosphomethylpyrimidine kinase